MGKSNRLRIQDVRAAFRLLGECRDLGVDPTRWGRHMYERLPGLIGARAATGGEIQWRRGDLRGEVFCAFATGFDSRELALFMQYLQTLGPAGDPMFARMVCLSGRHLVRTRPPTVSDRDWYGSAYYDTYRRASRIDHGLASLLRLAADGTSSFVGLHRTVGEPNFSGRQVRLMRLFHDEVGRLIGTALASAADPDPAAGLSPRLRQTLDCLLDGDSEKQVAARLGLSVPTVHQYVTALYRHFGVNSRAELLAYFLRRSGRG